MLRAALALALVVLLLSGCSSDNGAQRVSPAGGSPITSAPATSASPAPSLPAPAASVSASVAAPPATGDGSQSSPLAIGGTATVGSFRVAVTTVQLNANEVIATECEDNDPPTGQFVLVGLTATNTGTAAASPGIDLSVAMVGGDGKEYDDLSCNALVARDGNLVEDLAPGQAASFNLCLDVPARAIDGGSLFVEELLADDEDARIFWRSA